MDMRLLGRYYNLFRKELYDNVLPFWMRHSPDRKYGGYFHCLDRFGSVYDDRKYMWLQGRQAWVFSRLYNSVEKKAEWLETAKLGVDFMRKYGRAPDGRVYFSLTRDGKPYFIQRKIFSECFYIMGLCEYAKASGDGTAYSEALELFRKVVEWTTDASKLGRPVLSGQEDSSSLAVPMILLNLAEEIEREGNRKDFEALKKSWAEEIKLHVRPELKLVLENVRRDGKLIDSPDGRLVNPGHAIETGWFMLHYALKNNDMDLVAAGRDIINWSYDLGWDKKYGGIYYFLDAKKMPPAQLEWSMKLFWPLTEAIYGFLLLYHLTGESKYLAKFRKVTDFTLRHFSDPKYGGWFGYADRQCRVTNTCKGSAYKGCFHIPRFLLYSLQLMEKMGVKP